VAACNDNSRCSLFTSPVTVTTSTAVEPDINLSQITINSGAACSRQVVPFDPTPPTPPAPGLTDPFPTFQTTCPTDPPVGTFKLAHRRFRAHARRPIALDLAWTAPQRWRDLREVTTQLLAAHGRVAATLRFSAPASELTLAPGHRRRAAHDVTVGHRGILRAAGFTVTVGRNAVHAAGPAARTVHLRVKLAAPSGRYAIAVGASDFNGRTQRPVPGGILTVRR
jgi:hypothetical protein